jgi:EmrB/QacA subfamily drug resistance transporter
MMNRSAGQEDSTSIPDPPSTTNSTGSNKWMVLIAIGIGTFMSALDGSVVNTTLPVIRQTFSSTIAGIEWIVTVYLLVLSGLLLSFGHLGDLLGHKKVYNSGFGIFVLFSALCGLAASLPMLILFRGFQAVGAAMLQANSPAILTGSFPVRQRGQALGLQATMTYLGLTVGPSLGGWLAGELGWRSIFFINIPVGLVALILTMRFIPAGQKNAQPQRFDFAGAGVFLFGLALLLFGLNQGYTLGWDSWSIRLSLLSAGLLLVGFVLLEQRREHPMLDFHLFSNYTFSISTISAVINYIGVYTIVFLMPFYLIQGLSLEPSRAGLILTVMPACMAIVAPISGTLSDRVGTRLPAVLGMMLLTAGLALLANLSAMSSVAQIAGRLALAGFGIGIFISPNTSAMMGSAPRDRQGIASGILATSRNFGMVLGVGVAGAIFTSHLGTTQNLETGLIFQAISASFGVIAWITGAGILITALDQRKHGG